MTKVSVQQLWKTWGQFTAIRGAELEVQEGEFLTLLGESGCGKTTTLRCIAGLERPTSGTIRMGDDFVFDSSRGIDVPAERRDVGMVFQSYALWPHMTVLGNVAYPLRNRSLSRKESRLRALETLRVVGLDHLASRPAAALSGGQQQRVALARAITARPRVMLYDEPLSNLDPSLRRSMRDEINKIHNLGGTTSIYVTHDLEEAMHLSDRVVVMHQGLLEQIARPDEIYSAPATEYVARFVGFENVVPAVEVNRIGNERTVELPSLAGARMVVSDARDSLEAVCYAIRAENLIVTPIGDAESLHGELVGTVGEVTYLGAHTELRVRVGEGQVTVALDEQRRYAVGQGLSVGARVRVVPAEGMGRLVMPGAGTSTAAVAATTTTEATTREMSIGL